MAGFFDRVLRRLPSRADGTSIGRSLARAIREPLLRAIQAHVVAIEASQRFHAEAAEKAAGNTARQIADLKNEIREQRDQTRSVADTTHQDLRTQIDLLESILIHDFDLRSVRATNDPSTKSGSKVSIVLPTFNRAHCVHDAIESVIGQRYQNWELIIVDDGSTDGTAEKIAPYLDDARIRYVRQSHAGHSAARNHALSLARGDIVTYLDSDNIWYPDFLFAMVREFNADAALDFAYGALVTDWHEAATRKILFKPFDRAALLRGNYIDVNVVAHRRALVERHGGFDIELRRFTDWDLALRFSAETPARAIPVLAAKYRVRDKIRVSDTCPLGPAQFAIGQKWYPPASVTRRPRVLYVLWHYPQLSESYIETEIRCMLRWGIDIEVWYDATPVSPYKSLVPTHNGSLPDAIARVKPDIIHVHWLNIAIDHERHLQDLKIPVTIRLHGFEVTPETLKTLLARKWVSAVYGFPHQVKFADNADPRVLAVMCPFDTSLFGPEAEKDPLLVVRTSAALASKDLPFFLALAERHPRHRFVLAGVTCNDREAYPGEMRALHAKMKSRVEMMFDLQRDEIVKLVSRAGIYVHTARRPGETNATPIGMPISIAEAMATGAYLVVPDIPELADYAGGAGDGYHDLEHASRLISATTLWSQAEWRKRWMRSVDRAFLLYADERALRPMLENWLALTDTRTADGDALH